MRFLSSGCFLSKLSYGVNNPVKHRKILGTSKRNLSAVYEDFECEQVLVSES